MNRFLNGVALTMLLGATISTVSAHAQISADVIVTAEALRDRAIAGSGAFSIVESLTTEVGARMSGSPADARAVSWAKAKFTALGYDRVYTEPVVHQVWRRDHETAQIVLPYPHQITVTALGGSVGTGVQPLSAEVVRFASIAELKGAPPAWLKGKIAFISARMERRLDGGGYAPVVAGRTDGASIAAEKGAVALLVRSLGTDDNRLPHTGSVIYATGRRIPAAAVSAPDANLLDTMFRNSLHVNVKLDIATSTATHYSSENVIGEITGRDLKDDVILIGAHLDSWDLGTGAVDDGAGVALTMAAGKMIQDLPVHPRRTVRVVLFANEELGYDGARVYADKDASAIAHHKIAAESDWGTGRAYAFRSAALHPALASAIGKVLAPISITTERIPGTPGPDLGALAKKGVPWVQFAQDATTMFDDHHSANDTLDKIDAAALDQNAAAYAVFAYMSAEMGGEVATKSK